jgi:hypothetical protein
MTSLILLGFGLMGFFEHSSLLPDKSNGMVSLFSENPLPAGASLILLLASPMILLTRKHSTALRAVLILGLASSMALIIVLAKKGPTLSSIVILLFSVFFIHRKYLKFLLVLAVLAGCLFLTSESTLSKYKNLFKLNESIILRAELYSFGFHLFKENPVWGVGFNSNLRRYFDDYDLIVPDKISSDSYWLNYSGTGHFDSGKRGVKIPPWEKRYKWHNTLENIALSFLVQMGGLFSALYFGGVIYIFIVFSKKFWAPPQNNLAGMLTIAVMVGFAFISCTFDTLRFPNLNWLFHSFLGLMVNLPQNSSASHPDSS